jgi:Histidine kinase
MIRAECAAMVPSAAPSEARFLGSRAPYLARALRSVGFGLAIGTGIALLRGQSIPITLLYSVCIALLCWFSIDVGRRVLVGWLYRERLQDCPDDLRGWPGWGWMVTIVIAGSAFGFAGGTALGDLLTGARSPNFFGLGNLRETLSDLMFALVPAVVITYFYRAHGIIADREASAQAARRQAAESRLRLLEAQLEPHMFFNTLANLHVLIALDPPRAQAMLDQLIAFLRATLSGSRAVEQPLRAEFARIADYLALMQVRMEHRLRIHLELPDSLADIPVPPLLLQPIVENCIKHGLEPAVAGGLINVRAVRDGNTLVLSVRDTGVGLRDGQGEGTSFGLRHVRERLETLYGSNASLSLRAAADADGGTLALIRLPI